MVVGRLDEHSSQDLKRSPKTLAEESDLMMNVGNEKRLGADEKRDQ